MTNVKCEEHEGLMLLFMTTFLLLLLLLAAGMAVFLKGDPHCLHATIVFDFFFSGEAIAFFVLKTLPPLRYHLLVFFEA